MAAEEVFDQLVEVSLLFEADMARTMADLGLSATKTHLLWEVHLSGPCPQQRLAEALGISARHVTSLVDALEVDGFARRTPHPHDRRAVLVELTEKGSSILGEMQRQRTRDAAELVADLDAASVEKLQQSLAAVLVRLRHLVADSGEGS